MSKEELKSKFEELKLTKDELDRFSEAMKKEEFRKLLVDYAQEISDPVNRELYEKEITQLEQERGQNVTFIQPEPGFCMKTVVTTTNDNNKTSKCFINICTNKNIEKPTSKRETRKTGETGLVWYIPHTCSPAREDYDKSGEQLCFVYDVVFNPDSYRMAETNDRFKDLLKSSAMDTIETSFNVKLDRANVKILKNLNFKGRPTATILRRPSEQQPQNSKVTNEYGDDLIKPLIDQIKENNLDKELAKRMMKTTPATTNNKEEERKQESKYTTPNYKLIHRGQSDMQDYASNDLTRYNVTTTRPKELVISIELPLCKSSQNVLLDVFETRLHLESNEPYYKLDLNLPYPVRENEAKAKFDKSKRCLNVTLTVVPFVVKIEDDYFFPSSSSSSTSTSSLPSSFEESSSLSTSPSPIIHVPTTTTNNNDNKPIIKYSLPDLFHLNETTKTINLKLKIVNYVKDSIQIEFDSQSALNLKCESCSSSGSYIKYYSIYLSFFYSHSHKSVDFIDLLSTNNKNYQIVFIDDDYFEIKINKSNDYFTQLNDTSSELSKQAHVLLDKMSLDNSTVVNLNKIPDEIIEEEENNNNNNVNFENMNNLTKKEFILNFKNNAENHEKDDDDDEDDEFEEAQEDVNYQSFKLLKSDVMAEKIEEEPESFDIITENDINNNTNNETYEDCCEHDYIKSQINNDSNEEEEEDDDDDNDYEENNINNGQDTSCKNNKETLSLSSSSTNFSNDSNNSLANRLKSILKKPRSYSESESSVPLQLQHQQQSSLRNSFGSSDCNSNSESLSDMTCTHNKKSVSFNKQVIRNVFKPGSTVNGMKKPNPNKNKKKNKRKRTVSDPSSDVSQHKSEQANLNNSTSNKLRPRNMSESSDDNSSQTNSDILLSEENMSEDKNNNNNNKQDDDDENKKQTDSKQQQQQKKKKKNNKKNNKASKQNDENNNTDEAKNPLDLEKMISWKNEGRLNSSDDTTMNVHKTQCSFKFKNKFINVLDD